MLTHSGRILRRLVADAELDAKYTDLWETEAEERAGKISPEKLSELNDAVYEGRQVVALGRWVHRCINSVDDHWFKDLIAPLVIYLPHPASRRRYDLVALSKGLVEIHRRPKESLGRILV